MIKLFENRQEAEHCALVHYISGESVEVRKYFVWWLLGFRWGFKSNLEG
jgi:hypothetical protein